MNPIDPRPPPRRIHRAVGAEHHDRSAIAPRVVNRHRRMHQTNVAVHRCRHRVSRDLCIAVRDRDRMLLVEHHQHLRRSIAEIVDEAVVQMPVTRTGIERDEFDSEPPQHLGDYVAAPFEPDGLIRRRPLDISHVVKVHGSPSLNGRSSQPWLRPRPSGQDARTTFPCSSSRSGVCFAASRTFGCQVTRPALVPPSIARSTPVSSPALRKPRITPGGTETTSSGSRMTSFSELSPQKTAHLPEKVMKTSTVG